MHTNKAATLIECTNKAKQEKTSAKKTKTKCNINRYRDKNQKTPKPTKSKCSMVFKKKKPKKTNNKQNHKRGNEKPYIAMHQIVLLHVLERRRHANKDVRQLRFGEFQCVDQFVQTVVCERRGRGCVVLCCVALRCVALCCVVCCDV
jgi:hypothetical protein